MPTTPSTTTRISDLDPRRLNRSSFVPLYYQLQELLKEQIESSVWLPGDVLPSEPELARTLGVSRVVVRQALAILEDDRQIVRVRGRGTFVAQPKLEHRAGGLSRLLAGPRDPEIEIQVLDKSRVGVEQSIRQSLEAGDESVLRITTLMTVRGVALAIGYSFFRESEVGWLAEAAHVGRPLPAGLTLADYGIELTRSVVSIETSQCGRFEATHFGVPPRSAVFLVLCREYRRSDGGEAPFEVARVEYRGDVLQFRLDLGSTASADGLAATFELSDKGDGRR
jgi:DNA-binding GntR family transcriptional regulator